MIISASCNELCLFEKSSAFLYVFIYSFKECDSSEICSFVYVLYFLATFSKISISDLLKKVLSKLFLGLNLVALFFWFISFFWISTKSEKLSIYDLNPSSPELIAILKLSAGFPLTKKKLFFINRILQMNNYKRTCSTLLVRSAKSKPWNHVISMVSGFLTAIPTLWFQPKTPPSYQTRDDRCCRCY